MSVRTDVRYPGTEKTEDKKFHIDVSLACPSSPRTKIPFDFC